MLLWALQLVSSPTAHWVHCRTKGSRARQMQVQRNTVAPHWYVRNYCIFRVVALQKLGPTKTFSVSMSSDQTSAYFSQGPWKNISARSCCTKLATVAKKKRTTSNEALLLFMYGLHTPTQSPKVQFWARAVSYEMQVALQLRARQVWGNCTCFPTSPVPKVCCL